MGVRDILLRERHSRSYAAGVVVVVASGGNLVIPMGLQLPVSLNRDILLVKHFFIIPVALDYGFRHIREELVRLVLYLGVVPKHIIGPDPRAGAIFLHHSVEEQEVLPPVIVEPLDYNPVMLLMSSGFLIHSQVEETGMAKDRADLVDDVFTELIVLVRGDHPGIVAHPSVVAGGEIKLGDGFKPQPPYFLQLPLETIH